MPYFTAILRTQLAQWQCRSGFLVPAIITNKILSGQSFIFNFKSLPHQLLTFLYMPILLQLIKSSCFGLKLDDGMVFYYVIICFLVCPPTPPFLLACRVFLFSLYISTYMFTSFSSDCLFVCLFFPSGHFYLNNLLQFIIFFTFWVKDMNIFYLFYFACPYI